MARLGRCFLPDQPMHVIHGLFRPPPNWTQARGQGRLDPAADWTSFSSGASRLSTGPSNRLQHAIGSRSIAELAELTALRSHYSRRAHSSSDVELRLCRLFRRRSDL